MVTAPRPADAPASVRSGGTAAWLGCMGWLAVGLAARVGWAVREELPLAEWSARGFVQAWHATGLSDWNRFTPPLAGWLLARLHELRPLPGVLDVRLGALGLSVAALLAAWLLAALLARSTRLPIRSLGRGLGWLTAVWALHPSLVASAVEPSPDGLLGGALCLALCGPALALAGHGLLGWLLLTAGTAAALLAGGVALAAAAAVGLLIYLAPIPRLGALARVATALAAAGALACTLQGFGAEGRLATPDEGPAESLAALLQLPETSVHAQAVHPDRRILARYTEVGAALAAADAGHVLADAAERVLLDQLGPGRFAAAGALAWPLELLDLFLRGGALLFAVAVLGRLRPRGDSAWPRAGVVAALAVLALLRAVAGVGPWAFAPLDLALLGVAGAGAAASRPDRARTRWLAFAAGGLVACTLALVPALSDRGASRWLLDLGHDGPWGAGLVERLADGGPDDGIGQLAVAELLMLPAMPSLRMPEAALEHASRAVELAPTDDAVTGALLRAYVENLRFDDAVELGAGWHPADPAWAKRAGVLPQWALEQARKLRLESDG